MNPRKIFVSYAPEDQSDVESFLEQSVKESLPFHLGYTRQKEAMNPEWMARTRDEVNHSDAILVLITKNISLSECAYWEMKCSNESGKPMLSMFIGGAGIMHKPMDIRPVPAMVLSWNRLRDFVSKL